MGKGLFDSVLDGWPEGTGKEGTPHSWPVLHTLNREYHCAAWPEDDGGGLVLYPDAGLLASAPGTAGPQGGKPGVGFKQDASKKKGL